MIKYGELVQYIKENHVNWNTDLFDVLKGFFESHYQKYSPPNHAVTSLQQQRTPLPTESFHHPANGEYTAQDVLNLFSL